MRDWVDRTVYAQSDVKREPSVFVCIAGNMHVKVHRYVGCSGWFVSALDLDLSTHQLSSIIIEDAKVEALRLVDKLLAEKLAKIKEVRNDIQIMLSEQ